MGITRFGDTSHCAFCGVFQEAHYCLTDLQSLRRWIPAMIEYYICGRSGLRMNLTPKKLTRLNRSRSIILHDVFERLARLQARCYWPKQSRDVDAYVKVAYHARNIRQRRELSRYTQ